MTFRPGSPAIVLAALAIVVTALDLAEALLVPLALALLLAFLLAPVVGRLERVGLPRVVSVAATALVVGIFVASTAIVAAREVSRLASDVSGFRENLLHKVESLRGPLGSVSAATRWFEQLEQRLERAAGGGSRPPRVEVVEPARPLETARDLVSPLLAPLGTAGIVAILVIFLLLQRDDLRDRLLRLAGDRELGVTTEAMNAAGERVSRYLGAQALLCSIHGTVVALGLAAIGVPGALLWGVLSALLRFVPYVGPWIAATLPCALALVAFDAWTPFLLTTGFFVALELVSNNVLEPWICGTRVGLSPFAVVLSAIFWAWLWGGVGLILATPLTACLVVLGRFVPSLEFLSILLSDEPALDPVTRLHHRVLALDSAEAGAILREARESDRTGVAASDALVLPLLGRLGRDLAAGDLAAERAQAIAEMLDELLDTDAAAAEPVHPFALSAPAHGSPFDVLASAWLAHVLSASGFPTALASPDALASEVAERARRLRVRVVTVAATSRAGAFRARHVAKRIAMLPEPPAIALGRWDAPGSRTGRELRTVTTCAELVAWLRGEQVLSAAVAPAPGGAASAGATGA